MNRAKGITNAPELIDPPENVYVSRALHLPNHEAAARVCEVARAEHLRIEWSVEQPVAGHFIVVARKNGLVVDVV